MQVSIKILERVLESHNFQYEEAAVGGAAIDATGEALPAATLNMRKLTGDSLAALVAPSGRICP